MKKFKFECLTKESSINVYSDPEFAALMWQEVESDKNFLESSDDVKTLALRQGDVIEAEWLGFEVVEDEKVTNLRLTQTFGGALDVLSSIPVIDCKGWIPTARFELKEGTQDGIKITRIQ